MIANDQSLLSGASILRCCFVAILALLLGACEPPPTSRAVPPPPTTTTAIATNSVVEYLTDAEIQAETDGQRSELRKAFADMLTLSADELTTRRYAGFDGTAGVRSLPELLAAHVVPAKPAALTPAQFFADVKQPAAQASVRKLLNDMEHEGSASPR